MKTKKKYAINEFLKHAKETYGVVKYKYDYLIVSKTLPDFIVTSGCTFGNYKGGQITEPLNIKKTNDKALDEIIAPFEEMIKKQQEQYEKLEKLKAPSLEKISQELERDIKSYGKTKFVNQYDGYSQALLAGAVEIAFNERVDLKGDITVGILKKSSSSPIKYVLLNPQTKKEIKGIQKGIKELENDKTDRAQRIRKAIEQDLEAKIEKVNANKVKKNIKQDMKEIQAWLYLLTAWCDVKEQQYAISKKAIEAVNDNSRGKELEEEFELFNFHNIDDGKVGYINKIEKRELTYYEAVAFFDTLVSAYDRGIIKNQYILVDGKPKKENLKKVQKDYPVITSQTMEELTRINNRSFIHNVKEALKNFDQIEWQMVGYIEEEKKEEGKQRKQVVFKIKPVSFKRSLEIEGGGKFYLYEIAEDLFKYEVKQNKRTFAVLDKGAFSRISKSKANSKTKNDATDLLIALIKQAGSKRTGDRKTYISYDFFGDMKTQHKTRSKERIIRALEVLKEVGDIEDYKDYKGKFIVDLGG